MGSHSRGRVARRTSPQRRPAGGTIGTRSMTMSGSQPLGMLALGVATLATITTVALGYAPQQPVPATPCSITISSIKVDRNVLHATERPNEAVVTVQVSV